MSSLLVMLLAQPALPDRVPAEVIHTGIYGLDVDGHFEERVAEVSSYGFDLAVSPADKGALDILERHHMKALAALWLTRDATKDPVAWRAFLDGVRRKVSAYREHPALFAWYVSDEPDGQRIPPSNLRELRDVIRSLDRKTPLLAVFDSPARWSDYIPFVDIVAVDPYLRRTALGNFEPPDVVSSWLTQAQSAIRAADTPKPLWVVLGAFVLRPKASGAVGNYRKPSPDEFRDMVRRSVASGVRGILVYTYATRDSANARGWHLPSDDAALWAAVKSLPSIARAPTQ